MEIEMWDVLDKNRVSTGRLHRRGEPLAPGDYHLVVSVWIKNSEGRYLISKRAPEIPGAGMWQCTAGSAIAGDSSLTAALREAREELGVELNPSMGRCLYEKIAGTAIWDVWLFTHDIDITDIALQEGETCDAKWAAPSEILDLYNAGVFAPGYADLPQLFEETV